MLHEPAASKGKNYAPEYKTRLGVVMCLLYAVVYGGFMAINLAAPTLMAEETPLFGMNLAVVYGFGLIIVALVMALIYNTLCTRKENALRAADPDVVGKGAQE